MTSHLRESAARLRDFALGLPGAYEDHPWGEVAVKVHKKIFIVFGREAELDTYLRFSVKLPDSGRYALMKPYAQPTGYGLGKSGWVTVRFQSKEKPPTDLFLEWIDESYRAIAPKKLIARLDAPKPETEPRPAKRKKGKTGKK
jgi:predicted DNA-binding protein (MmcQ/YjbR family)